MNKIPLLIRVVIRKLLHTKTRKDDTYDYLKSIVGEAMVSCDIEMVAPEITACSQGPPFVIPPAITEDTFNLEMLDKCQNGSHHSNSVSVMIDNSLSPVHTLIQIVCVDHKGLIYDIMRTLKDYNIQVLVKGKVVISFFNMPSNPPSHFDYA